MKRFTWLAALSLLFVVLGTGARGPEPTWVQRWDEASHGR